MGRDNNCMRPGGAGGSTSTSTYGNPGYQLLVWKPQPGANFTLYLTIVLTNKTPGYVARRYSKYHYTTYLLIPSKLLLEPLNAHQRHHVIITDGLEVPKVIRWRGTGVGDLGVRRRSWDSHPVKGGTVYIRKYTAHV